MSKGICFICNDPARESRPYGVAGSPICFECMTATPQRQAEAGRQFAKKLDGIKGPAFLTEDGPVSLFSAIPTKGPFQ